MTTALLIAARRNELGLTLEDIARHVGVSKSTVKKWESGFIKNMKRDKMALLAEVLKISPMALLDENLSKASHEPTTQKKFTPQELTHLENYRRLDANGRELVDSVIEKLQEQHSEKSDEPSVTPWQSAINS